MNRNILIAIIVVIIIAAVGFFVFSQHAPTDSKINTQINFLGESTLQNGEAVQFELKDAQGNAIANQNVNITFVEDGVNQTYHIVTDNQGKGALVLNGEDAGTYQVTVIYGGDDKYNGCTATKTITIEEGTSDEAETSEDTAETPEATNSSASTSQYNNESSSSGEPSELYYDSEYNFYYDQNGIIRGGQSDGYSAEYVRESYRSGDMVDEEGNLQ